MQPCLTPEVVEILDDSFCPTFNTLAEFYLASSYAKLQLFGGIASC